MSHHPRCIRFQTAAGYDPNLPCSCGYDRIIAPVGAEAEFAELRAARCEAKESYDDAVSAARAWALADRTADDRTADMQGIERVIAMSERPIPAEFLAARERAMTALREACVAEGHAETALKEAAHRLLDEGHARSGS